MLVLTWAATWYRVGLVSEVAVTMTVSVKYQGASGGMETETVKAAASSGSSGPSWRAESSLCQVCGPRARV